MQVRIDAVPIDRGRRRNFATMRSSPRSSAWAIRWRDWWACPRHHREFIEKNALSVA
jgi:hypothetical protein